MRLNHNPNLVIPGARTMRAVRTQRILPPLQFRPRRGRHDTLVWQPRHPLPDEIELASQRYVSHLIEDALKLWRREPGTMSTNLCCALFVVILVTDVISSPSVGSEHERSMPAEFVYLRDVDPTILQDVRYAGYNNFTGKPVPGYGAAECVLLSPVAAALKRVQSDLAGHNLSLKVYDCYRPVSAVQAFIAWARHGKFDTATKRFYPRLEKSELMDTYISSSSTHSNGNAVDLTLVQLPAATELEFDPTKRYGTCTGPDELRAPDNSLDMGTGFDCFDAKSHTASLEIKLEQSQHRAMLVAAMERRGFKNYPGEWWHFSYPLARGMPVKAHDFPIVGRVNTKP